MANFNLTEKDIKQIEERGLTLEKVISQIKVFEKGFPPLRLRRACTLGDGITVLEKNDLERLTKVYSQAALSGRAMKFVPASGAASRMFKLLLFFDNRYDQINEKDIRAKAKNSDHDFKAFVEFIGGIKKFAFYDELKSAMSRDGLHIETLMSRGQYKDILAYILTPKGLNLANMPKGLIRFHVYRDHSRTPFEEHLVEGAAYIQDENKVVRIHFTVSPEHEKPIKDHIEKLRSSYEKSGIKYQLTYSTQRTSTDTIAVDMDNRPFWDRDGRLVFRPGGHGALLGNLNDLKGDIIFLKNIDNVVPDRLKEETYTYKKALGGYLIQLQKESFGYLQRLSMQDVNEPLLKRAFEFARHKLSIIPPKGMEGSSRREKTSFLLSKLNRPLRVCGMVRNEGEPGGGPFWVETSDKTASLQIVESSQVDMSSPEQRVVWDSATHFNPVDLVCGVRDYSGRPFDLMDFVDPNTGFISFKSKEGRELKALELPGLWNGAMTHWNTVFVEVPIMTFNPVKTVLDLLRKEHQPE